MGLFRKSINHSKSSKKLDKKIKNLDEDMKKTGVTIDGGDASFLVEKKEENEKSNWREELQGDEIQKEDLTEQCINEVREKHHKLELVENSIESTKIKEAQNIFRELYQSQVEQVVEKYISSHSKDIVSLREDLFVELQKKPTIDIDSLEEKINTLAIKYKKLSEGLLNDPSKNSDPLTQNPINLEQLKNHYQLLVGRLQEQLATLGGGGEVRLKYLDDIVGIATNASAYDGQYLKYDHSQGKFVFDVVSGAVGAAGTWAVDAIGINTTKNVGIGTTAQVGYKLYVQGDVKVTGIVTIGTSSITLNGPSNQVTVGTGVTIYGNTGIISAKSIYLNGVAIGATGAQGIQGLQGLQGIQGIQGTQGLQGTQGRQGIQGTQGTTGAQGIQGLTGTGTQGTTGSQGITGSGTQGTTGTQGLTGTQGTTGSQGITGSGTQGTTGSQGTTGTQGATGTQGTIGSGTQGVQGPIGPGGGAQGTTGSQGIQGTTGSQGIQGIQGTQGLQGQQGTQGLQGAQGRQGTQGTIGSSGARNYTVTNSGASDYVIDGSNDPTLNLLRGFTYTFSVNASGHPFWIKTAQVIGTGSAYNNGVTNNGTDNGTITFAVPYNAPSTLYYICQYHIDMVGTISITDVGPQGVQGTQGIQGLQGVQGITGTGTQGTQGLTGTGTQGIQGVQGPVGGGGSGETYWAATGVGIHTLSNVGVGTTNPKSILQIQRYGVETGIVQHTSQSGITSTIDSFNTSSLNFLTAEYTVHVGCGTFIQSQKVLVMHNGEYAYSQEYGVMYQPELIVSFGATMSGSTVTFQATPETGITGVTTYRFVRGTLL